MSAPAEDIEPLDRILESARRFLVEGIGSDPNFDTRIEIGKLDSRLRLARCEHRPKAQLAPGSRLQGNSTVNVRCSSPVSWSIFVPVSIERYAQVIVAARPLSRDQRISASDLRLERMETSSLSHGYFQDIRAVSGLKTRRSLTPGQVLIDAHVTQPLLVERGQRVTLYSVKPGLTVRVQGIALENGTEGERIRVRNPSSKRIVEGIVDSSGAVQVRL